MLTMMNSTDCNNHGVALLVQGSYKEAIVVFRQAIVGKDTSTDPLPTGTDHSTASTYSTGSSSGGVCLHSGITVKVLTYDHTGIPLIASSLKYGPSQSVVYPLQANNQYDNAVSTTLALYNLGLAHYCLYRAKQVSKSSNSKSMQAALSNAHKNLSRAYDISLQNSAIDNDNCDADMFTKHMLSLATQGVIVNALTQVLSESKFNEQAESTSVIVQKIYRYLKANKRSIIQQATNLRAISA